MRFQLSFADFISLHEQEIASKLHQTFRDCYKSPYSLLILDNLERLLSYSEVGVRYFNYVLQALLSLLVKQPPKVHLTLCLHRTDRSRDVAFSSSAQLEIWVRFKF